MNLLVQLEACCLLPEPISTYYQPHQKNIAKWNFIQNSNISNQEDAFEMCCLQNNYQFLQISVY